MEGEYVTIHASFVGQYALKSFDYEQDKDYGMDRKRLDQEKDMALIIFYFQWRALIQSK